jgi:hypothetical protein
LGGANRPVTAIRWLGSSERHSPPEASSTTGARNATLSAPAPIDSTRAGTTKLSRRNSPPCCGNARGSSVTTASITVEARCSTSSATGPVLTACTRKAVVPATAATHPSTATTTFRQPAIPSAGTMTTTTSRPASTTTATTAPVEAEQPSKMRAVAHEARAGSTR